MEKIVYILLIIFFENNNYKNIRIISPTSYDFIVNKNNKLNNNYIPKDLEQISLEFSCKDKYLRLEAKKAFEEMAKDAKKEGYNIVAVSAYRSYNYQNKLFNNYVKEMGYYNALIASAKAGHSEHQTGLAIDISNNSLDYDKFENTKEFYWVKKNSYKYGFILRYPKGKYHITGFKYEPWHYRYVGLDTAKYINKNKLTLEEYYKKTRN